MCVTQKTAQEERVTASLSQAKSEYTRLADRKRKAFKGRNPSVSPVTVSSAVVKNNGTPAEILRI